MLLDISPLCLYHNIPMILTQQTLDPRRFLEETYYCFACSVRDCNQRYDMGHGYYVMRNGSVEDATNKEPQTEAVTRLPNPKHLSKLRPHLYRRVLHA
jgi:hypothetical protein